MGKVWKGRERGVKITTRVEVAALVGHFRKYILHLFRALVQLLFGHFGLIVSTLAWLSAL